MREGERARVRECTVTVSQIKGALALLLLRRLGARKQEEVTPTRQSRSRGEVHASYKQGSHASRPLVYRRHVHTPHSRSGTCRRCCVARLRAGDLARLAYQRGHTASTLYFYRMVSIESIRVVMCIPAHAALRASTAACTLMLCRCRDWCAP